MIKDVNARRKVDFLLPFITGASSVLDFGCGDLSMARTLIERIPNLRLTGIDVVDFGVRDRRIAFQVYSGKKLPFAKSSFDTVIAWHVFHHTIDPYTSFEQCMRISRRLVIFVEPVWRFRLEMPGMALMDWLFNVWKTRNVAMTFAFQSESWWKKTINKNKGIVVGQQDVDFLPPFLPTGRSLLFAVQKHGV